MEKTRVFGWRFFLICGVIGLLVSGTASGADDSAPAEPLDDGTPEAEASTPEATARPPAEPVLFEALRVVGAASEIGTLPGSATVIEPVELERQGQTDIQRILLRVPGVYVQEEEGWGLRPNIGMRGSGTERSSRVTLLEDGVLIAPAPYSAPSAYYFPTAGRMHAIEVRKGSSSIEQGPYTTGGVLNLLSTPVPGSLTGKVEAFAGEDDLLNLHAHVGQTFGQWGFMLETFRFETDGFKDLDGGGPTGFEQEDYLGKLRWSTRTGAPVHHAVELKLGRADHFGDETYLGLTQDDFERTPFRRYAGSQQDYLDTEHEQYQLTWMMVPRDDLAITTTVYRNDFFRNWHKLQSVNGRSLGGVLDNPEDFATELDILRGEIDSDPGALRIRNNRRDYYGEGVQSVLQWSLGGQSIEHALELGIRYHEDAEDRFQEEDSWQMVDGRMQLTALGAPGSNANRVSSAEALAFFVTDRIDLGRWTVTPGVRYETIDFERRDWARTDPGREDSPRLRLNGTDVWIPGIGVTRELGSDMSVFGGVHKGFAPPGPGRTEETEAEESVNYELGWRWGRSGSAVQAVAFYNDYDNLLGRDTLSSGGSGTGDLFNGGAVEVSGLELSWDAELASRLGLDAGRFSVPLNLAYTWTEATFQSSFESDYEPWGTVVEGDELPYLPENQFFLGTGLSAGRWGLFADFTWVDEMRTEAGQGAIPEGSGTDARFLIDLSGRFEVIRGLDLVARVRNLTDEVYVAGRAPAGARPGLPRTAMVGFSWGF